MLVPMEGHGCSRALHEEVDVTVKEGRRLIAAGFAEPVKITSTIETAMDKLRGAERRAAKPAGDAS
ncbi:hypothetical protein [Phenylobacterium sp.]|uniref:hypothetical protein n=1 Tax=Phenylobacterium sp. TaxID=1871053 RepID=UPI002736F40E|nr:hypothetical protein [Phenylobacterium sp.]MDP3853624.1 hypothetical protein [Phenylobacterium sp.]